jgi:Zn-dependent protease with chaperone function
MHSQAESRSRSHLAATAPSLHTAAGLGLYLLTLSVEAVLGASLRWLLVFLGAATVGLLLPLRLSAETVAWIAAVAPLLHSSAAFALPSRGWFWRRRLGARRPSANEAELIEDALSLLQLAAIDSRLAIYVLDNPLPSAAVRGRALVLTRQLVESDGLPAVLAHELGHLHSLDGRLTDALQRLRLLDLPLSPVPQSGGESAGSAPAGQPSLLRMLFRALLRLAAGGAGERLLAPAWAAHWRSREHAADAYAAALGQAEDLAQHLADLHLPLDGPRAARPFNRSQHPPVAHRIERLTGSHRLAVSK